MKKLEIEKPDKKRRRIENLVRLDPSDGSASEKPGETVRSNSRVTEDALGSSDISERLKQFLPQLKEANEQLDQEALNLEDVNDDEEYVEMNLGLGVLEEKQDTESEDESESVETGDDDDLLDKLLGRQSKAEKRILIETLEQDDDTSDVDGKEDKPKSESQKPEVNDTKRSR